MATIKQGKRLARYTLATYGRGTLFCDSCGTDSGAYIDADANESDYARVADLMEHAAYFHITPREILFTGPAVVISTDTQVEGR